MKTASYIGLGIGLCTLIGLATPSFAAAAEVTVSTFQVIPPGSSCAPLQVINVHPYIVDNTLQSFDVTVSDPAYVAVVASAGDTDYSFRYISRWNEPNGGLRQHVDVQSTPIGSSLQVSLTLLSSKAGVPVCLSVIRFSIAGTEPVYTPHPPVTRVPPVHVPTVPAVPSTSTSSTSTTSSTVSVVRGMGFGTLSDICTPSGSLQLWFLLITLYLIGAAVVALREPVPERPLTTTTLLLLVPAIVLLVFWLMTSDCRGANWVPVVLTVIAIASLLAALWERQPAARIPELAAPATPKQIGPTITPTQIGAPSVTKWGK